MKKTTILDQQRFWEIIEYFVKLDNVTKFSDICENLCVTRNQLNSLIIFFKEVGYQFETMGSKDEKVLLPLECEPVIKIDFSLLEWLEFQAHFPLISSLESKPFHKDIKNKLTQVENTHQEHDLFEPLPVLESLWEQAPLSLVEGDSHTKEKGIIAFIEESVIDRKVIEFQYQQQAQQVYPRKLVFIDNHLHLIGESTIDSCLISVAVANISNLFEVEKIWKENYTSLEIHEFIKSLRSMSSCSIRLVLKIFSQERFSLNLEHQFFEKPCMFSNTSGDYIWAATIEPNEKIYEWLCELGSDVEILDPKEFKVDFIEYCENKLKKLA